MQVEDYLGVDHAPDPGLPGRSFADLLDGESGSAAGREDVERDRVVVYDEYGPVRMIRTRTWKYVHRYPYGPHELYDLEADPGEEANLAESPEHADIRIELADRFDAWTAVPPSTCVLHMYSAALVRSGLLTANQTALMTFETT